MTGERQRFDAQCASFVCIAWDASLPFNIFQHTCKDSYTSRQICHVPSRAWIIKNEICTSLLVSMFCNVLLPSAPIKGFEWCLRCPLSGLLFLAFITCHSQLTSCIPASRILMLIDLHSDVSRATSSNNMQTNSNPRLYSNVGYSPRKKLV